MIFYDLAGRKSEMNMFPRTQIRGGDRVHIRLVDGMERDAVVHTCLDGWLVPQFDSLGLEPADVAELRMLRPER